MALCSILFVVDIQTKQVEEVGEGVDYGVRKRKTANVSAQQARQEEEDKFLKGVRICRNCRPILLCVPTFTQPPCMLLPISLRRHQYEQQMQVVPPFVNLYEVNFHLMTHNLNEHNDYRTSSI